MTRVISQQNLANFNALVEVLKQNNGRVVDDHQGRTEENYTLAGVAALVKGDRVRAVALCNSRYFSVNEMYLEDGKVHISRTSIGGAVMPMDYNMDIVRAVEGYNTDQAGYPFSSGQLEHVFMFNQPSHQAA